MRGKILLVAAALGASACDLAPDAPALPPPATLAGYQCDDMRVAAEFSGDGVKLTLGERTLALRHVPSGSGAKYADDAGNEFWTKDGALLTLAGQPMRQCTLVAEP